MAGEIRAKLEELISGITKNPDVDGCALVRRDGVMIASVLPAQTDKRTVALMSAALVGTAETCSKEFKQGPFAQLIAEAELGKIIAVAAGELAVLVCIVKSNAALPPIIAAMNTAAKKSAEILA